MLNTSPDKIDARNLREKLHDRERSNTPLGGEDEEERGWEDLEEHGETQRTTTDTQEIPTPNGTPPPTPRKRRVRIRTDYIASGRSYRKLNLPVTSKPLSRPTGQPKQDSLVQPIVQPIASGEEMHAAFNKGMRSALIYLHDITSRFFYYAKKPIPFLLAFWALSMLVTMLVHPIYRTLLTTLSPLCVLPGISTMSLCRNINSVEAQGRPLHAEYPRMVEMQSKTFEQLLDESIGGSSLALEIKKAEMATADLVTVVRTSDFRSKDHLADSLGTFIGTARDTARGLQKLNAKVSGSVDSILAISDYALRTIETSESSRSSLMKHVWPFGSNAASEVLASTFVQSLSVLSTSLENLILQAEVSLRSLDDLEAQLGAIHEILVREDTTLSAEHSELLAALWTRLGGNRARKQRYEANFDILRELGSYRTRALAHVVAALQALQTLSADMEVLRERASGPELAGNEIPMEVHARAIRNGVQRLNEERLKAKGKEEEALRRILGVGASDG